MDHILWLEFESRIQLSFDKYDYGASLEELYATIEYMPFEDVWDPESKKIIGFVKFRYYNFTLAMNEDMSISDAFHSSTHVKVEDILFDLRKKYFKDKIIDLVGDTLNHNVLIIDDFGIYPEYRSKGFGKEVLDGIARQFQGRCGLIVLKSLPKQLEFDNDATGANPRMRYDLLEQDERKAQRKLNAFYKKCGFTKMSTPDGYYFIMNINPV